MEQTWLTVDELAAVLKVSPKSIRRAYRKGEIPVDRFCRFVRFDLERVKEALKAVGVEAIALQGDLTTATAVDKLFSEVVAAIGRPDIAINTTGMVIKKPIPDITEEDYDKIFAINSKAAFFFIQSAGKHLNDGGKLCTIVTSLLGAFTGAVPASAGVADRNEAESRRANKRMARIGPQNGRRRPGWARTPS